MHSVVITGLGCVSALGLGIDVFWNALTAGRSGIGLITQVPSQQLSIRVGAEVPAYRAEDHFDAKRLGLLDRFSQFALLAAREAVEDAGLTFSEQLGRRCGVIIGTGVGGKTTDDAAFEKLYGQGNPRVHPAVIPRLMASSATSQLTMEFGVTGPAFTVSSACSSANHAVGQALGLIRQGSADIVLTGGSEACFTLGTMKAWEAMRVMAPDTCRPFSRGRRGMVLGEGAAIVVLESANHARARGASIYAELAGFGMSADADHLIHPNEIGAARAMEAALADARLSPEDISYINAHGTGTEVNDVTETRAIRRVFGRHADALAVSSTKGAHGHALGASGALELAATVLALQRRSVPPTVNFLEPDPACDLNYIPNEARDMAVGAALSNSFAFGGLNAVLALKKSAS